jgi:tetratricopeptide (TPR) repeat protein
MQYCKLFRLAVAVILVGTIPLSSEANAQSPNETSICKIGSIQGRATAKRHDGTQLETVRLNDLFYPGDRIRTGKHCRIAIVLANDTVLRIDENTSVVFTGVQEKRSFLIELIQGAVHFFSRKARSLKVTTPFVNAVVEGTEFLVKVERDHTFISLFEGRILTDNAQGSLLMSKGQSVVAHAGQAPVFKAIARPRDAVQWTLYYPAIIDFEINGDQSPYPGDLQSKLEQSMAAHRRGDLDSALAIIDGVGEEIGDARFYIYRAGLSLTVGRVARALADIQKAIDLQADNSQAFALRAIVAVVQNRKAAAYADAQKAVDLNPASPAALIALSYAHQARFNLDKAVEAAQTAVKKAPGHAIARARLAELRLSTGDLDGAVRAAQRSADLNPNNSRAHTVLGYANLTRINITAAKEAFDKAIELDSAAPLPRLGRGLAKIRQGHLASGRADIELAAGLDPGNALIRSYLGKAYFDEKRSPLEARQLEIAKELDPMDPTPWFYDAIRKQTQNRPVEALHDLQKSIELNDYRAVYRSRLLMDEDLAARSASLGRIYRDLGFEELALRQGLHSLHADPSNYSAHRLLADSYSSRPRHEIARVSELLQAQLLQPLNITPVQPQLAESNLLSLEGTGPNSVSFNEFNPLFTSNRVAAQIDGLVGDNETWGEKVALSGVYDRISGSVGQFHYETDGFRTNNDLDQDIYSVLMQAALTPKVNVQTEYRNRRDKHGDLRSYWSLEPLDTDTLQELETFRQETKTDILRIGMHLKPIHHSDIIASVIYQDVNTDRDLLWGQDLPAGIDLENESTSYELQYLYKSHLIDIITGGGYYNIDRKLILSVNNEPFPLPDEENSHGNGYVYSYLRYPAHMTWTIGASFDSLDRNQYPDKKKFNPKIGVNIDIAQNTLLRLAAFSGLKRTLVADQTIEPTHVAGFNQFFDDFNWSEHKFYGVGIDQKINNNLYGGAEFFLREIKSFSSGAISEELEEDWEENVLRFYVYWTLNRYFAVGMEYRYELFEIDNQIIPSNYEDWKMPPEEMETETIPINLTYFHPSGGFGRLTATHVSQEGEMYWQPEGALKDDFLLVDMTVGYRLPKRYGFLSAEISNLFDQEFNFIDYSARSSQEFISPMFLPQRTFVIRLTMSF